MNYNQKAFSDLLNNCMYSFDGKRKMKQTVDHWIRLNQVTTTVLIDLIATIPMNDESGYRLAEACISCLHWISFTVEDAVQIVNHPQLFSMMESSIRNRVYRRIMEEADLSKVGVAWIRSVQNPGRDVLSPFEAYQKLLPTHALEMIQDAGDHWINKADAYLLSCLQEGRGATQESTTKTREFLGACHLLKMKTLHPLEQAKLASEMIIMITGSQSRECKEYGNDLIVNIAQTEMKTLTFLEKIITDQMELYNAGEVLRWTMGKHRHQHWFWERLMQHLKTKKHWRIGTLTEFKDLGRGIKYRYPNSTKDIIVVMVEGNESLTGTMNVGDTVMTAPSIVHGAPIDRNENCSVYRGVIHPFRPPSRTMVEAVSGKK